MFKRFVYFLLLLVIFFTFTLTSCRKDKDAKPAIEAGERENTIDHTTAEANFDNAIDMSNDATTVWQNDLARTNGEEEINQRAFGCAQVVNIERGIDPATNRPFRRFTLDFGNGSNPVPCLDGRTRRGKIIVYILLPANYNNPLRIPLHLISGAEKTVTFDEYFVDNVKVEGRIKVSNITNGQPVINLNTGQITGVNGNLKYLRKVENGKLIFPDNTTFQWQAEKTIEWLEGWNSIVNLQNPFNDRFSVYGSYQGTNRRQAAFNATVSQNNPLIIFTGCIPRVHKPISGVVNLTIARANQPPRNMIIDYGNGTCDNTFTVTVNGQTVVINP
ncbi:MAG: hypothetical protein NZ551_06390 [Microscillaceae bacterium]|nr:hypothetical protein [Microscillaceae bacterium]MDW8460822.1 hypothetical protein [Cytophagales bacterium]